MTYTPRPVSTLTSVTPGQPPMLALDDGSVIICTPSALPAPELTEQGDGSGILRLHRHRPGQVAVPAAFMPAVREALAEQLARLVLRPLLLGVTFTDTEACFTVQQQEGRGLELVAPVPLIVDMRERGAEYDVDLFTLDHAPAFSFSAPADSPALLELCREMLRGQGEALPLPVVASVNPYTPPVLVLEDQRVIRLSDLPAPVLIESQGGAAVLVSDSGKPTAPAYRVPASLAADVAAMVDRQAGKASVLVRVEVSPDTVTCYGLLGEQVTVPRPCWPQLGFPVPREAGQPVDLTIYTNCPRNLTSAPAQGESWRWRVYPETDAGRAVLDALSPPSRVRDALAD